MGRGWLLAAALAVGCATTPAVTPTFTYAPPAGTRLVRTVKLVNETTLVGSPFRQVADQQLARAAAAPVGEERLHEDAVHVGDGVVCRADPPPGGVRRLDDRCDPGPCSTWRPKSGYRFRDHPARTSVGSWSPSGSVVALSRRSGHPGRRGGKPMPVAGETAHVRRSPPALMPVVVR